MDDTLSRPALFVPAPKYSSLPEDIDTALVDAVDTILEQGDVAVCKTTRSGFTTSAIIAAHRKGLKILIVSPTKKMLSSTVRNTVENIEGVYCNIPGNQSCKYVKEVIEKDKFLAEMPIPKEKCSKCNGYSTCPVTAIERIKNFTVVTMTYSKLEAIIMSEEESDRIGDKLSDIDLVIFDEAHTISYPSLPQVDFDKHVAIPLTWDYHAITGVYNRFRRLMNQNQEHVDRIKNETEERPDQYTGFQIEIPDPTSLKILHLQFEQLLQIAETRKFWWPKDIADDNVRALRDIINIMGGITATISYIKDGDIEKMVVTGGQGNIQGAISNFLTFFTPKANVCFVSGTLIGCRPGFSDLTMREITNVIFPDIHNTDAKMHIYPSKWKFSAKDAQNGIDRAIKEIQELNEELGHQPISLFAMNKRFSEQLQKRLGDYANIKVDYYRSEDTIGISRPERISIAVGLAHIPKHSCDPLAQGANDHERYLDSQQLRLNEVHAATWQAWSRVKDPYGMVESHLYCIGIRADEISDAVTWGTKRTVKATSDSEGKRIWTVEVDEELARPIVHAEERTSKGLNRHGIHEYIDRVQSVKSLIDYRMKSQRSPQFPYNRNDNRENVDILGNSHILYLFNDPSNDDELEWTSFALNMLFTGRLDCHACQSKKPGKDGEYSFRKTETTTDVPSLIAKHLDGSETIGFYPFDDQDQCYYCAIDLDDHDGKTPQYDNAKKLSKFLLDNNLPVLVEKITSHDSYHIWIPIIPTKTHAVYKFVRQILHDAGVKGDAYPKQKSIGNCYKSCGDFLMLPLGIDSENVGTSVFVDPRTLEPIGLVYVDKVIRLRDVAEPRTEPLPEGQEGRE